MSKEENKIIINDNEIRPTRRCWVFPVVFIDKNKDVDYSGTVLITNSNVIKNEAILEPNVKESILIVNNDLPHSLFDLTSYEEGIILEENHIFEKYCLYKNAHDRVMGIMDKEMWGYNLPFVESPICEPRESSPRNEIIESLRKRGYLSLIPYGNYEYEEFIKNMKLPSIYSQYK
jgi:hypothetical protein